MHGRSSTNGLRASLERGISPLEELPLNLLRVLWRLDAKTEAPVHDIRRKLEILT
jgi:hypothetical protein